MAGLCEGGNEPPGSLNANKNSVDEYKHTALKPDDNAKRQSFCEEMQLRMEIEGFIELLVFGDEATLYLSVKVHKHNVRIWALENRNSYVEHVRDSPK
ncbi:hypothetical protein ANN_14920 [Periplaneta americana]|uniref:Uncharacterized protein n=1 Tax=Periplaneta americana TaxID=6978 RepID=A0ABQ8SYV1_PERAM|nr:hypothetical protein ANN_14920 [Periplaneta americana]